MAEVEGDYLAYWLNKFISSGIITRQHLMYQNIDAFMTEQLTQPNPVINWEHWPTLFSYCESLAEVASRKGYTFYLGDKCFGLKGHRDIACEQALYLGLTRDLFWARAASGGGRIGVGLKSGRERIGAGA